MGNKKYVALAILLFLVLGVFIYNANDHRTMVPGVYASEISLEPTKQDSGGVDLDTEFVFQAKGELDPKYISQNITVHPSLEFTVKKGDGNQEVVLVPQEALQPEKVYQFSLAGADGIPSRWAFQTKGVFKVVSTLPSDKTAGVPTDTGIEINLSHLNFGEISQYFSIEPEVKGTFEVHKKTTVFVPEKLEPATIYTVTIKKGLPLRGSDQILEEDYVFQFETKAEVEDKGQELYLNIYKNTHEFTTQEKPFFQLGFFSINKGEAPPAIISVYSYQSPTDYITALQTREKIPYWAFQSRANYLENTSALTQIASFSVPIQGYENLSVLEFPEALQEGFYLAEISVEDSKQQVWFQVTNLGIYGALADNKTLIWVNDLSSGLPVADAQVKLINGEPNKTDSQGLIQIPTPEDYAHGVYAVITKGEQVGVAAILPWGYVDPKREKMYHLQNSYWRYFYLDRSLYKPNDTVHFWGVLKPRDSQNKLPEKVTITLTKNVNDSQAIASKEIQVRGFDFTGSLQLPNLLPGYYSLNVEVADQTIISEGFSVENYNKPVYQIEATPQRKAIFAGEKVDFQVKATFFEGTPAAKIPINYYLHDQNGQVTTDSQGEASISHSSEYRAGSYPIQPRYLYLTANLPESGEIYGQASVWVLYNDLQINSQGKVEEGTARIDLEVNKLTLEKVNSGQVDPWENDAFIEGSASKRSIQVKIYEEIWEKHEIGQYYDFINKKVMPKFDYQYKKVPYLENVISTDENGKAVYSFPVKEKSAYLVEFSAQDFRGNTAFNEQRVYGSSFSMEYDYPWYHLEQENTSCKYNTGEEVNIHFKRNESSIQSRENGFLFITCRDGIREGKLQDTGLFRETFTEGLVPNYWVKGVYFDGRYYYETPETNVMFNEEEKSLDIQISTDKEEYRPGDLVQVNLQVKDKNNKPISAQVNLNLVDEALYALQDQHVDILRSLYGDTLRSGLLGTLLTHQPPDPGLGMAEHGGEGGGERKDFKDNVFFKTLTTDRNGKASAQFQVPDNLTSWRLTCQAITEDLAGGSTTAQVRVKLPFFVDMVLADTYLAGDEITVPIRSYGTKLQENTSVQYEVTLKSGEEAVTQQSLSGLAFTPQGVPLPPLEKGDYNLTLTGKSTNGLTDTLTLSFRVEDSLATQAQTEFYLLEERINLTEKADSLVTLIFADYQRSQYLDLLWRLTMISGVRIDQKVATVLGRSYMQEYFPELIPGEIPQDINYLDYQTPEGGISLLPYSGEDLELSVKLACLDLSAFDRASLSQYFSKIVNDRFETRERAIIALCGLAALEEPVLQELNLISQYEDLNVKEQLYLSFAFMELGDENGAIHIMNSLLENHCEDLGSYLRINVGKDQDDVLEATAMAAALAMGLDFQEEANKLESYVLDNKAEDILLYPEQLLFLQQALPNLSSDSVGFSYKLDNKVEEVDLEPRKPFSLVLTPDQIEEIEFLDIKGQVGVTALYQVPFQPPADINRDEVKITREYQVDGKPTRELAIDDLVRVKISYQFGSKAPDGMYQVSDFLPAGLKIVQRPYQRGVNDDYLGYPLEVNGSKAVFLVNGEKDGSFTYYARVINPGKFRAESAILQHVKSGIVYSVTSEDEVSIK